MCNELIAQLTGHNVQDVQDGKYHLPQRNYVVARMLCANPHPGLRQLVLLNIIVANQDGITDTIAKQRLVFFVKHLTGWLELQDDESIPLTVRSEVYRAFSLLLPLMKDIYGEHWENILNSLTSFWSSAGHFKDQGLGYEEYAFRH